MNEKGAVERKMGRSVVRVILSFPASLAFTFLWFHWFSEVWGGLGVNYRGWVLGAEFQIGVQLLSTLVLYGGWSLGALLIGTMVAPREGRRVFFWTVSLIVIAISALIAVSFWLSPSEDFPGVPSALHYTRVLILVVFGIYLARLLLLQLGFVDRPTREAPFSCKGGEVRG